jgi:hypothetical protein
VQELLKRNPLLDGSVAEVVVDNDDRYKVTRRGKWKVEKTGGFGPSFFIADSTDAEKIK